MSFIIRKIYKNFPTVIKNPRRISLLLKNRLFPIGIILNNPEIYQAIGSLTFGVIARQPVTDVFPGIQKITVTILRAFDRSFETSLDSHEILVLSAIVKYVEAKNILEIGTSNGNTALNLAANSPPDALITTVDLPHNWDGHLEFTVPDLMINVTERNEVGLQYKNTNYSAKIKQILVDSAMINWKAMAVPFDLVFIDGCHYYEYVKRDTENAMRYLKSGGLIIWHDYGMIYDVSKVVDEAAKRIKTNVIQGTRLAVGFIEQPASFRD